MSYKPSDTKRANAGCATSKDANDKVSNRCGAIAAQPSFVVLPQQQNPQHHTVMDFLIAKFPQIAAKVWLDRVTSGKVHWLNGELISVSTAYVPSARVYYYREVEAETQVPFSEVILHQDEHKMIVYKPHFLPVTPGGNYVNECLVHRLRKRTGIDTIAPAHRLDKDTAGVMLMTVNPDTRHAYHQLFVDGAIQKHYQALAMLTADILKQYQQGQLKLPHMWTVKNRIEPADPSFIMQITPGEVNSHSQISLVAIHNNIGLFELSPITGKTHQLRVHMQSLGMPLINDRFYPVLQPKGPDNFAKPLKLLAQRLQFIDPISQQHNDWCCEGLDLSLI
ncbi:pseudouridine synthase [Shewanella aestuarii]|uniref:Pseudouridine synthase n=1 Tax=Shewanella aestuarii TaxID=1028752 RepID=A0A6G9QMV9_9GAMM|nr:pseudouridine synthase [Shewanella aestuarii]QIR15738.1 pseudouridine synthase [Shewanella aestuarii]